MDAPLKRHNSSSRNLYLHKSSLKDIDVKVGAKQSTNKLTIKNEKYKKPSLRNACVKTHEQELEKNLPFIKKRSQKRQSKHTSNWQNTLKGYQNCEISEADYFTEQNLCQQIKASKNSTANADLIRKSIQQSQKTVPIESCSTAQTKNLIKQIIAKSRSRRYLQTRLAGEVPNCINNYKRAFSQQRQDKSDSKSRDSRAIFAEYNPSQNIRSCKEINLFRINSKKNLVLDRTDQHKNFLERLQGRTNTHQSLDKVANVIVKQSGAKPYLFSKKSSHLEIKENINDLNQQTAHTKTETVDFIDLAEEISEIKELSMSDINSELESSIEIPEIDCSIIIESQEATNKSSFLNETAKNMFTRLTRHKQKDLNELNYQIHSNASKAAVGGIQPAHLKKLFDQKNRKKILEVDKLRKKFPNDFFKS